MSNQREKAMYWNDYYSGKKIIDALIPSQFCVFVADELEEESFIVDVGCGTGRDAFFFSHRGHHVIGVDGSESAIKYCVKKSEQGNGKADFLCQQITEKSIINTISQANKRCLPVVIYARFFLHAICDSEEECFFELCNKLPSVSTLAFEFRTIRDQSLQKETATHYRRFIDPMAIISKIRSMNFDISYYVEGFGFAKYKKDDAYVARCIAVKKNNR